MSTPFDYMMSDRDYFEDFVTRSTYHSNAIEGSTLSYAETYAILWNDNSLKIRATARELYEAINLKYALYFAMGDRDPELRESLIKQVASQINKNINELDSYRRVPVFIRGAEHVPPAAARVPQAMMELVYAYNQAVRSGEDPLRREAEFHIRFERIHPFEDGNGRTGRVLLQRGCMLSGLEPPVITVDSRADYMDLIASQDVDGLKGLLSELCESERERMEIFREAQQERDVQQGQNTPLYELTPSREQCVGRPNLDDEDPCL